jgi:protein phosphatase
MGAATPPGGGSLMRVETIGLTNAGRVRSNNEDAVLVLNDLSTIVVADGMGGENCGEVASALAMDRLSGYLRAPAEQLPPAERLMEAVRAANVAVYALSRERVECKGMGCTVVALNWEGGVASVVNVGDSRAYLFRSGELRQLSYDQNVGNDLKNSLGLTDEQVRRYPHHRHLTMAVGIGADVLMRTHSEPIERGDLFLLCSDGLTGPVSEEKIIEMLQSKTALPALAAQLIDAANAAGGPDNVTVALMRVLES